MPVIPGHQVVGIVEKLGPGCRGDPCPRRPGWHRLAAVHLRPMRILRRRPGKPLRAGPLHRLSRRRRLRRICRGARGLRLRHPRRLQRRRGGAAALCRHHRLSGAGAGQSAPRRNPGHVRLRLVGPRADPDRPAPRLPGLRSHPRRAAPRVGPADGGGLGGGRRGRYAAADRQRDPLRPGGRVGAAGAGSARRRAARWPWPAST